MSEHSQPGPESSEEAAPPDPVQAAIAASRAPLDAEREFREGQARAQQGMIDHIEANQPVSRERDEQLAHLRHERVRDLIVARDMVERADRVADIIASDPDRLTAPSKHGERAEPDPDKAHLLAIATDEQEMMLAGRAPQPTEKKPHGAPDTMQGLHEDVERAYAKDPTITAPPTRAEDTETPPPESPPKPKRRWSPRDLFRS